MQSLEKIFFIISRNGTNKSGSCVSRCIKNAAVNVNQTSYAICHNTWPDLQTYLNHLYMYSYFDSVYFVVNICTKCVLLVKLNLLQPLKALLKAASTSLCVGCISASSKNSQNLFFCRRSFTANERNIFINSVQKHTIWSEKSRH